MSHFIELLYPCGCRDEWPVINPPRPEDVTARCDSPCVPEHCQSCQVRGRMCADREAAQVYKPVDFAEVTPVRRIAKRKAPAA